MIRKSAPMTTSDVPKTSKKRRARGLVGGRPFASQPPVNSRAYGEDGDEPENERHEPRLELQHRRFVRFAQKFIERPGQTEQRQVTGDDQRFEKPSRRALIEPFPDPEMRMAQDRRHEGQPGVSDDVGPLQPPLGPARAYEESVNRLSEIAEVPQTSAQTQGEQRYFGAANAVAAVDH